MSATARAIAWPPTILAALVVAFLLAACQPPLCPEPPHGYAATCHVSVAVQHVPVVGSATSDE